MRAALCTSQSSAVLSADAEKTFSPSGDQCTSSTAFWWPRNVSVFLHSPKTSHSRSSLSCEPDTMWRPSGLNLLDRTGPACPVSSMMGASSSDVLCGPATWMAPRPLLAVVSVVSAVFGFFAVSTRAPPSGASAARFSIAKCDSTALAIAACHRVN
eukprot:scaffold52343_cov56-Phaeocystis_antarctica.AAC.3